ncbi:MAG: rRNA maturation RNase YbeY [Candidatus Spechtbacteria bacterium RIFCSPLOWO2_12_FULL_38_22]|uniref:Endoribonuclease YbeY n=1 Tax=Candidatus Spechtbacteria bacterium RIFCSPLOWO2_12_FULL_38_22 TaxID=1802165 RepID=A0A1G2HIK9_9BACT|nr:MAG: rRNA maturation RNase YbeY [Candidatus Spechtbacteria bacterium RIFCSPHIGHO2_01_FULL_38_11]OGZ59690.1 MAG: rRNA maturation RNase YbeY [Candidatus Spechtbacteria bacterium RIFCSPLOWO2_01_FULL_38_20]OGZ59868.1 MAG: rRNA maturation RNase YbeY [Candidatus Spechtbacteria bacterium RIFCSPHIGHO2_12_FULL_38_30]OGZ61718.1 MAG: rRNA maturation RNase YbeY [Candidatus Spechtbacteria bacterium RIFCSPLOWO2_12_FULL_38_22]
MLNIKNETNFLIDKKLITACVKETLKIKKSDSSLIVVFVASDKMRQINNNYNKQDKATDVLSFNSEEEGYLGEIVVCPEFINKKFVKYEWELCHSVVHGTFHLLNIHHEDEKSYKKIHKTEQKIIDKIFTSLKLK